MNPKFSIGEQVILQSPNLSEYNGEYTVHAVVENEDEFTCRLTGRSLWTDEPGVSYILDEPLVDLLKCDGAETFWAESSLKKKQIPGSLSYDELIQTLHLPIYEVN